MKLKIPLLSLIICILICSASCTEANAAASDLIKDGTLTVKGATNYNIAHGKSYPYTYAVSRASGSSHSDYFSPPRARSDKLLSGAESQAIFYYGNITIGYCTVSYGGTAGNWYYTMYVCPSTGNAAATYYYLVPYYVNGFVIDDALLGVDGNVYQKNVSATVYTYPTQASRNRCTSHPELYISSEYSLNQNNYPIPITHSFATYNTMTYGISNIGSYNTINLVNCTLNPHTMALPAFCNNSGKAVEINGGQYTGAPALSGSNKS